MANVRNFYVEADIDGRETTLGGGPRAKDGEMTVHIHQRCDGGISSDVVKVTCKECNGQLTTTVIVDGKVVSKITTKR